MKSLIVIVTLLLPPTWVMAQVTSVPPNPLPANPLPADLPAEQEGVETLTRGPIHEAFANPAEPDPEPNPIVPQKPPQDVPEQPPEYEPEGGEFIWIPGYWEWDDERDEFLWVTGVWRQPPPDMRWVPGYWIEADGGWRRVKGFWMADQVDNVTYYQEAPPQTLEVGPSSPAPADNYFWIPGNWNYANTGYVWQAGYWAPYQQNWVWVPSRWCWTPAGFVFLPGHWDYLVANRGQIFAPVYFRNTVYTNPGWYYQPSVVIPTNNLFIYLWVRPRLGCYYFGNYFGPTYANLGFVPWANLHVHYRNRQYYDPFFSYCRVHYRQQGVDFVGRVQGWHRYYDQHPDHRPPRNWREQQEWLASRRDRDRDGGAGTQLVARRLDDVARGGDSSVHVKKIDPKTREEIAKHASRLRELDSERRRLEREQAQVSTRTTAQGDRDRDRDRDKAGSLVDRAEKAGRPDRPGADRPDRPNISDRGEKTDRGDKGEKGERPDRGDKGEKGAPGRDNIARTSTTTKLMLPKTEPPRLSSSAVRTLDAEKGKSGKTKAPPVPTATRRPGTADDRGPATRRGADLPDTGRPADRSTSGAKTVEPARGPDLITPGTPRADVGRGQKGDSPGKGKASTENPPGPPVRRNIETPTRDQKTPRAEPPRPSDTQRPQPPQKADTPRGPTPRGEQPRPSDVPRVQPTRPSDTPRVQPPTRNPDVPRVQPPRPQTEGPRLDSPGKSGDSPRNQPRDRGNDPPRGGNTERRIPSNTPGVSNPQPRIEAPRPQPRIEPPANRNPAPRSEQPTFRSSPPRNEPSGNNPGASRPSNRDNSPSSSSNNNRGKGKNGNDN